MAKAKERPILFSGPMVSAILDGRKCVTRRIVKPQPDTPSALDFEWCHPSSGCVAAESPQELLKFCPFGAPGDRLWVREAFYPAFKRTPTNNGCVYRADYHPVHGTGTLDTTLHDDKARWKTPLFMPRWASRLTLEVVSVGVERLQEITNAEIVAEGFECMQDGDGLLAAMTSVPDSWGPAKTAFADGWDALHGKGSWAANPWVWRIGFRRAP